MVSGHCQGWLLGGLHNVLVTTRDGFCTCGRHSEWFLRVVWSNEFLARIDLQLRFLVSFPLLFFFVFVPPRAVSITCGSRDAGIVCRCAIQAFASQPRPGSIRDPFIFARIEGRSRRIRILESRSFAERFDHSELLVFGTLTIPVMQFCCAVNILILVVTERFMKD